MKQTFNLVFDGEDYRLEDKETREVGLYFVCGEGAAALGFTYDRCVFEISDKNPKKKGWEKLNIDKGNEYYECLITFGDVSFEPDGFFTAFVDAILEFDNGYDLQNEVAWNADFWIKVTEIN